jgi:hypothetical protein
VRHSRKDYKAGSEHELASADEKALVGLGLATMIAVAKTEKAEAEEPAKADKPKSTKKVKK